MKYPLIILGAGASHDYSSGGGLTPPLTKDLVDHSQINHNIVRKYPEVSGLLSQIEAAVNRQGKSFEEAIHDIKNDFGHKSNVQTQIVALQFYLQDIFKDISNPDNFNKINNYKIIQEYINNYYNGNACVVSFNYDTLFEESMIGNPWVNMQSYIKGNTKLIKPHGSHDWNYIDHKSTYDFEFYGYKNEYDFLKANPDHLEKFRKPNMTPYHIKEVKRSNLLFFPAIAIPLPDKQDFICPAYHTQELIKELAKIDRIILIGWRAKEPIIMDLIKKYVRKETPFIVVSRTAVSAQEISDYFSSETGLKGKAIGTGFSNFIESKECKEFLAF